MPTLGDYLSEGRDALGISLEEISKRTCISIRQLEALETNRLERLPGGLFNISFARQYARELGLSEDEAASRIKEAMGLAVLPQPKMAVGRAAFSLDEPVSKLTEWATNFFSKHGGSAISALIGVGLIIGGFYAYNLKDKSATAEGPATVVEAASAAVPMAAAATPVTVVAKSQPAAPIELKIEVLETVWVRAVVDGERLFEETLSQGAVRPITAQQQVELKVGNAGGVLLSLNGEDLPAIGPRGHVQSVTVTSTGVELEAPGHLQPNRSAETQQATTASLSSSELAWPSPVR